MFYNEVLENAIKEKNINEISTEILYAYNYMKFDKCLSNTLVINDLSFMCDNEEKLYNFKQSLLKAGIKAFIYTNKSSGLMNDIHKLDSIGIKLNGICTVEYEKFDMLSCENKTLEKQGLKFIVVE